MIPIWEPIGLPWGFNETRTETLVRESQPHGVKIYANWQSRSQLVTSRIELLDITQDESALADYERMTLSLAARLTRDSCMNEIRRFADEMLRRALAGSRPYERVRDSRRGRIHLVRPFESVGACGLVGISGPGRDDSLTCKSCIRIALSHVNRMPNPLEFVALREDEILHSRKIATTRVWSKEELEFMIQLTRNTCRIL